MTRPILIADSSAAARATLLSALPPYWATVASEAISASEALAVCYSERPSIMFLDSKLPGMSGVDIIESLHQAKSTTTVILIADETTALACAQARASGAVAMMKKTLENADIESLLAACGLSEDEADRYEVD